MAGDSPGARMLLSHLAYRRMWRSQDAARAAELAERALAGGQLLAERGSEGRREIASVALTLIAADRLEAAAQLFDAGLEQARERGSRDGFAHISFLRGFLAYRRGAPRDVEADCRHVLAMALAAGVRLGAAASTAPLLMALLDRGALDEAAAALATLGLSDAELPPAVPYNLLLTGRGRLRLARGELAAGLPDLHECGRRCAAIGLRNAFLAPWRLHAALGHRSAGEPDTARALAHEELAAARDWDMPGPIGSALRLLGLLAPGDEPIELLRDAAARLAESPARLEHARALVDLGAALRRKNHRVEAREPLRRGLDLADQCGAMPLARRALDELAATGARPRRARLSGLESLTASERRVAEMAARGLSNVAIAQSLFVTRKTVEKHLGNTYMKLGVRSRSELPARMP